MQTPPFIVSPLAINLIAEISALLERYAIALENEDGLRLRKANRIKTIHSSLAIEGNTLSEDEVADIINGKNVVAPIRQIQEVRNAIKAYELYGTLNPFKEADLKKAHSVMMEALTDDAGRYRNAGVGVFGEKGLVHMAPSASMGPQLMGNLFEWLKSSQDHLLIRSCVFHYEFEFIHPFSDGNGRTGRLWQSLILGRLNPVFEHLPVENMVFSNQQQYYDAIAASTAAGQSGPFIDFMLTEIRDTLEKHKTTEKVPNKVPDKVPNKSETHILELLLKSPHITAAEIASEIGITDRAVRKIISALKGKGLVERVGSNKSGYCEKEIDDILKDMVGYDAKIEPAYMTKASPEIVDGKPILVIWVPSGLNRPYSVMESVVAKKSTPKFYVRSKSSTIEAKGEILDQVRALANRVPFDERGNEVIKIDDISGVLVYDHLKTVKSKLAENFISRPLIEILDEMDLLTGPQENRLIKNVAAMMFCEHPEKFFPVTQVDIVIFPEGSIENPDLMIEAPRITGPVPKMIKDTLSYLRTNVIKKKIAKPSDREESDKTFNYPYQAFEECISNALYHRDYQEREPVEITVEPTHVDILSYAGPDRSISSDAIKAAKKLKAWRYRNRRLGDFLKELDLTEGRATGIPTIQKALKDNGSAPATIETDDDRTYFLMTIPCRDGFARKLSEDDFEGNSNWTNRLGQTLGQISVQVQEAIKQSVITDKAQLGQLLEQMTVEVWNKSKRKEDISKMSEYVINILSLLKENSYSASSLIKILDFGDSKDFKRKLLNPMLSLGYIGMLYPDKPTSAKQAYRLTSIGLKLFGS